MLLITPLETKNSFQASATGSKIDIFVFMSRVNYVNSVMREINEMTDDIYESMMDEEYEEMNENIQRLIKILKDISKSHESE